MCEPVRLLHLSDLHFRGRTHWDSDPVLRALTGYIAGEVRGGLAPDLVVITGDLAFAGGKDEYAAARVWLERELWPVLTRDPAAPLPRERLLLVPGNHDVDRGQVDDVALMVQDGLLAGGNQDRIAVVLGSRDQRRILLKRHAAYLKFYAAWLGVAQPLPWWQRRIEIRGRHLHVAGLDSAWMACGDKDRGRLLLGRYQVHQSVLHPDGEGAEWRLALLHHPWDYLAEIDTRSAPQAIHLHRDLVLRGHLHEPDAYRVLPADPKRACLELAAGSVYDGSPYPNAFQWIELHPTPRRARVHFRVWNKGAWQPDCNQPGDDDHDGAVDFPLDSPSTLGVAPPPATAPEVPAAYLDWLRRTYAGFELLGQDAPQGQAIRLSQVYVPALTTPAPPGPADGSRRGRPGANPDPDLDLGQKEPRPNLLLARLNAQSLYCPAPPGGGKTTFCHWALLQAIPGGTEPHPIAPPDGFAEPPPDQLRGRLPLFVPLREFWCGMDHGQGRRLGCRVELEQALADWVDRLPPDGLTGPLLKAHLGHGSAFLLLDGLDEVPPSQQRDGRTVYPRALLLSGLADALPGWQTLGNRVLLTSRPYGLNGADLARLGLPSAPLEPLPQPLQELFVTRWFHTLQKPALAEGLGADLAGRAELAPLAENPMLLKAICIIYGSGQRLPEDKYRLYQRIIDNVLDNRYERDANERAPVKVALETVALGLHCGPEDEREAPVAEAAQTEVEGHLARFADRNPAYAAGRIQTALDCEGLLTRSGLLLPSGSDRAAFHHFSLQEFLAAERLARTQDDRASLEQVFRRRGPVAEWRQTLLFLFAAQVFTIRDAQWGLDLLGRLAADLDRRQVSANPAPALFIAEALDLCLAKGHPLPDGLAAGFRRTCLEAIADSIEVKARQTLGLCLGRLGDPRIKDLRDQAAYVEVPAGTYVYGNENEQFPIETPFLLSRYPVTNSQYRAFMEAGGYTDRDCWSDDGWAWLQQRGVTEPYYWQDRRWNAPNQPVVGVSFWEAQACCRWASGRLPTEHEWEAAARGPQGHEYPWGGPWEDGICNSDAAGLGVTSPVGLFPRSAQVPLGLEDLAGNCWEWCDDVYSEDKRAGGSSRVLRGGAFDYWAWFLRSSYRGRSGPWVRNQGIGFRCVLAAPRQP